MNRYMEGSSLTAKELKYLTLTSHELNMFIDRDQFKGYLELISPEFIHMLEINISEQILENYREARDIVAARREEFYLKKNNKDRSQLNKKKLDLRKSRSEAELILNRKHQSLVKKALIQKYFTDKYGKVAKYPLFLKPKRGSPSKQRSQVRIHKQGLAASHADKVLVAHKKVYSIDLSKKSLKASIYGNILESDYYKIKHPESKIIPLSLCQNKQREAEEILAEQQKFRTRSFDKKPADSKKRFFGVYSAGPFKGLKSEAKLNLENRHRAATIIQKNYRGYKARRIIKYMKSMNFTNLANRIKTANFALIIASQSCSKSRVDSKKPNLKRSTSIARQDTKKVMFASPSTIFNFNSLSPQNMDSDSLNEPKRMKSLADSDLYLMPGLSRQSSIPFSAPQKSLKKRSLPPPVILDSKTASLFIEACKDDDIDSIIKTDGRFMKRLINMPDIDGIYPIDIAINNNNLDMIVFFMENGANLAKCGLTEEKVLEKTKGPKYRRIREYLELIFRQKPKHKRAKTIGNFVQCLV